MTGDPLAEQQTDFDPYWYRATVDKVVDGDTIDVTIDLGFGTYRKERLRLYGIDAWETRGEERTKGLIAKEAVESFTEQKKVLIRTIKDRKGKFGRYLAVIYDDPRLASRQLNTWLVDNGHAERKVY